MKKVLALGLAAVVGAVMSTAVVNGASAAPQWQYPHNNFPHNSFPHNNFPNNNFPHNYPHNYPHGYHRHWGGGPVFGWGFGPYYDYDYDYGYDYVPYPSYAYPDSSAHVSWCLQHYRTYNARTDTFFIRKNVPARCVTPFD